MARILVADDHDDARSVFVSVLRDAGHEVVAAADGIDVIRMLRDDDPRLRILAVSAGWHPKLPVAIDGAPPRDVLQNARAAGVDATLSKPADHRFLASEVDRLVRERPGG